MASDSYFQFDDDNYMYNTISTILLAFNKRETGQLPTNSPIYCKNNWGNGHTRQQKYLTSIYYVQCYKLVCIIMIRQCNVQTSEYDPQAIIIIDICCMSCCVLMDLWYVLIASWDESLHGYCPVLNLSLSLTCIVSTLLGNLVVNDAYQCAFIDVSIHGCVPVKVV